MPTRSPALALVSVTLVLGLAAAHLAVAAEPAITLAMIVAQENAAPDDDAPMGEAPPNPQTLTNPNADRPVTAEELAECMESWDAETGMSKAEYERSCRSTLKYYPERP